MAATPPKPRLLLVEDDPAQGEFLVEVLAADYEVSLAVDGEQAWELAQSSGFDLVLADVLMPGMDGFELTRRLRAHGPTARVPIVLLSASRAIDLMVRGLRAGANDVRLKPFQTEELLAALSRWIGR